MKYSAGIVSRPFWYQETKKTAKLIDEGIPNNLLKQKVIEENTYQAPTEYRATQIFNATMRRLASFDDYLIKEVANSDLATSKILVLISIMKTDLLFFEFIYEVFRDKLLLGEKLIQDKDFSIFWSRKNEQSDVVSNWKDYTLDRLKQCYSRILFEAGVLEEPKGERKIMRPVIREDIYQYLIDNGMEAYVVALTGEK
ncbi:DUF1819 family protein [Anaerosolibacter sp.]|uniref:DUF1819 family protein n=1 Tax=Anaerosolibacter sp. TaxID=1872527 RepID=UPI0039F047B5